MSSQTKFSDFNWLEKPPSKVFVEADSLTSLEDGKQLLLSGGVKVWGENLTIRAEWLEAFPEEERVIVAGAVQVIEGDSVLLCERFELDQKHSRAVLYRARILIKKKSSVKNLQKCPTASGLIQAGINSLVLTGKRVVRKKNHYTIDRAGFTACDCGEQAPSWELRAWKADVVPEERAWLFAPILYLKGVPTFVFPVAYLPLSERRTGFLFPGVNYSGRDGFVLSESFFLTLGPSADTTFSLDWFETRGLRERIEFRARPSHQSGLVFRGSHISDKKVASQNQEFNRQAPTERWTGELELWSQSKSQLDFFGQIYIYSDSDINRDFVSELTGQAMDRAPSALVLSKRTNHWTLGADILYLQDLRWGRTNLLGTEAHDTIHRAGAFSAHLAPISFGSWPIYGSFYGQGANLSSLSSAFRDWGMDGTPDNREPFYPGAGADRAKDNVEGGEADGKLGHGELRRAFRVLLEPELVSVFSLAPYLGVMFGLQHRQLIYFPHGPQAPEPSSRGLSLARLDLHSELFRAYSGENRSLGHLLTPRLQWVGVWQGLTTDLDRLPYLDAHDRLMGDAQQLVFGFENRLFVLDTDQGDDLGIALQVIQGVDLVKQRLAQTVIEIDWKLPWVMGRCLLGLDLERKGLAEVDASLGIKDNRGDSLRVSYLYLPSEFDVVGRPLPLSLRLQQEYGLLFGPDWQYFRAMGEDLHAIQGSATLNIAWGLSFNLGAYLNLDQSKLTWYGGGMRYRSDCHCWETMVTVRMLQGQSYPDVFFMLELAFLGTAGVGSNQRF